MMTSLGRGRHPESGQRGFHQCRVATRRRSAGPAIAEIEKLRADFARETDPAKQKAIAEAVQLREAEYPTYINVGQWRQPFAMRKSRSRRAQRAGDDLWNVEKAGG